MANSIRLAQSLGSATAADLRAMLMGSGFGISGARMQTAAIEWDQFL